MGMEMPVTGPQHESLKKFIGHWEGKEVIQPGPWIPEGGKRTAVIKAKMDLGGFFLIQDYKQLDGKKTTYRGKGVVGFDAASGKYTCNWFDNCGGGSTASTGTLDKGSLSVEKVEPFGTQRYTWTLVKKGRLNFKMEMKAGPEWSTLMEGSYKLVK